jgi:hypothetical protein
MNLEQSFFHLSSDIFCIADMDGSIRQVNPAFEKILGFTTDELVAQLYLAFVHPDDVATTMKELEKLQQGIATRYCDRYRCKDGSYKSIEWTMQPVKEAGTIYAVGRDISDRQQVETALRESEKRLEREKKQSEERDRDRKLAEAAAEEQRRLLKAVTDNASVSLFIMDEHQHCVFMNPAAEAMTGFTLAEVKGRALHDIIHHTRPDGSHYPLEECPIDRAFPQNNQEQGEEVFVHKDGSFYSVSYTASPMRDENEIRGTVIEVRDMTQEKQAEQALRDSEARFRQLANSIPQLVWMANPDGWIFWYNQRWYDYTGTTEKDMEGWGWQSVHDPQELKRVLAGWRQSIETGELFEMEFPLKGADGLFRWFLTRVYPMKDTQGQVVLWFGTNTDISEQRRLAQERAALLEREQAARIEAERIVRMKDEFLATLSHELRTPLNAIFGWTLMLQKSNMNPAKIKQGLEIIERNVRMQTQLIEDLLDMSRILSGQMRLKVQRVELKSAIAAAIETVSLSAEAKEIRLQQVIDPAAGIVSGDPVRLQQIIWNLLSNAIKFTPKRGRVQVVLARVNSHVEISVIDTGAGINPEFLPYIFERFRQADSSITRKHGGLGLGLAIVKHLVELHGGTVQAESEGVGKGATFTVSLPIVALHPIPKVTPTLNSPNIDSTVTDDVNGLTLSGVKALVVDDEADTRDLIKAILESYQAEVATAASVPEALELFEYYQPNVLVSDIGMPQQDGYELIRTIRSRPPQEGGRIPAIALSAYARETDRQHSLLSGFQTHVVKPVEPLELVAAISSLVSLT